MTILPRNLPGHPRPESVVRTLIAIAIVVAVILSGSPVESAPEFDAPRVVLGNVPFTAHIGDPELEPGQTLEVHLSGVREPLTVILSAGEPVEIERIVLASDSTLVLSWDGGASNVDLHMLPGWTSLLPPLVAILLAILFHQVVLALVVGIWLGAVLAFGADPFTGFLRTFDTYIVGALADGDHVTVLVFSFLLGGMLGIIHRSGGTRGIVTVVAGWARTPRSGQLATWIMGLVIFIDDYANSLLVGNTMRPLTDRLKISREKLAYIVDSTAAPVASIAIISTWIGVEVGLIRDAFDGLGIERDAFGAFVASLPYRFYPIFALVFGFMIAVSGRDFGPMLKAERRARTTGKVLRDGAMPLADFESTSLEPREDRPARWFNAALPIVVVVGAVLTFIYFLGRQASIDAGDPLDLKTIVGNADSYAALLWASALGVVVALVLAVGQRILSIHEAVEAWAQGMKSILPAMTILTLAWAIGMITSDMHTADYMVERLGGTLSPQWIPALVFLLSGITSFATGSSWGTMGILMPLVIPLAHNLAPGNEVILLGSISSVLAGAVWGDHCSPISDTTVLSSMASSSDHVDHVTTQLPYAMLVGGVGILVGDLATALGVPFWISWVVGIAILAVFLRTVGKKSEAAA
jgi:Na+/H+ antiporter NhaC